ncbi:uncharacterized protein LOC111397503 [Olea europaea var. sylvestris]|uniref:uncharacterized protein LOC111397503 n=1 Tax=Olea europaea var. sylvestris TaxID=158386 RepID=UPI000C1D7672|nr:uncharacterized protein LOC111397503 [Olea europaea var. sylvestris]XP_022880234.1 uncharacterized protein LOC111397503 [Olea europaea var. sylvestris]XP_022880235.1 uncharacterized protein LOC111397503 [Olea europaea var. sylvestris]
MLAIHNSAGCSPQKQLTEWNRLGESLIPEIEEIEFPDSFLMHLRIVKIEWFYYETLILPLIEFVMKHASVLDKMVIEVRMPKSVGPECSVLAAQKLLRMPRSSPIAEVVFRWCNY